MYSSSFILNESSWGVFITWNYIIDSNNIKYDWSSFDRLIPYHNAIINKEYEELFPLLEEWDIILNDLNGEPTYRDWDKFRPLRLSREEDWADWLAHLIQTSEKGVFASEIFRIKGIDNYSFPKKVLREEISKKGYRADIIIQWQNRNYTYLEIKIGDPNLNKTFPASEAFRDKFDVKKSNWSNFILLLSYQIPEWDYLVETIESDTIISSITWEEVCIALRRSLLSEESIIWKVWAYTYLGAIEQILIGYPGYLLKKNKRPKESLDKKILILKNSLYHE
jgi:hypothetical protein